MDVSMSYRDKFEIVTITAENIGDFPGRRVGDEVNVRIPASQVDIRFLAQLAESIGYPYPDEP